MNRNLKDEYTLRIGGKKVSLCEPSIKKWEYIIRFNQNEFSMNDLGEQGWELVSVSDYYFYYKREVR